MAKFSFKEGVAIEIISIPELITSPAKLTNCQIKENPNYFDHPVWVVLASVYLAFPLYVLMCHSVFLNRESRKTYCAGISCICESRFALAKLRVSAQYLHRTLRFFEVPNRLINKCAMNRAWCLVFTCDS